MGILSSINNLADNYLEGYARGINPKYKAEQDAKEQAHIMEGIVKELGSYAAQDPLLLSRAMIGSGDPEIQEAGMQMLQQYQTGKTGDVKNFEWMNNLPPEEREKWLQLQGQGWKPHGEAYDSSIGGRVAKVQRMYNPSTNQWGEQVFNFGPNVREKHDLGGGRTAWASQPTANGIAGTYPSGFSFIQGAGAPRGDAVPQDWPTPAMGEARRAEAEQRFLEQLQGSPRTAQGGAGATQGGPATTVPTPMQTAPTGDPRAVAAQDVAQGGVQVPQQLPQDMAAMLGAQNIPQGQASPNSGQQVPAVGAEFGDIQVDQNGNPIRPPNIDDFAWNEILKQFNEARAKGVAKESLARKENYESARNQVASMNQSKYSVGRALQGAHDILINPAKNSSGAWIGFQPTVFGSKLPLSQASMSLNNVFETIRANLGVEMLTKIEKAGFSLAPISNFDAVAMQNAIASLSTQNTEQENYRNLQIIQEQYNNLVNSLNEQYAEAYPNDTETLNKITNTFPNTDINFKPWKEQRATQLELTKQLKDAGFITTPIREFVKGGDTNPVAVELLESKIRGGLNSGGQAIANTIGRAKNSSFNALEDVTNYLIGKGGTSSEVDMFPSFNTPKGYLANRVIDTYQITDDKNKRQIRKMPIRQLLEMLENAQR